MPTRNAARGTAVRRSSPTGQLWLIASVLVLAMGTWFSASAVVPALERAWHISDMQAIWLTSSVQVGFVIGAIGSAALNLPDRIHPQVVAGCGSFGAAISTASIAIWVDAFPPAVVLRVLTGMFLAGVYPVAMQLMVTWFRPIWRGFALGVLLGALALGSALPHLIRGFDQLPWQGVLITAATFAGVGGIIALAAVRPGPHAGTGRARLRPRYAIDMFKERGPRLANLGYFGHMWELYALWTWLPMFLLAAKPADEASVGIVSFVTIGIAGGLGCLLGGWASKGLGRGRAAGYAMIISGLCCLLSPVFFDSPWPGLVILILVWGASVIADSPVFSTALSEVADRRYTGTALTTQTALGFLLTLVTINIVPVMANFVGWQYAFVVLAPGPILGAAAMRSYRKRIETVSGEHANDRTVPRPPR